MWRSLLIKAVFLLIVQFDTAAYSSCYAQTTLTLWKYEDTVARLLSDGQSRRLVVETVGRNLAGSEPGSVLFDGRRVRSQYIGIFTLFDRCGNIPYPVTGAVSSDQRSISFQGRAPQLDNACRVVGWLDRNFDVVFLRPVQDVGVPVEIAEQHFERYPNNGNRAYLRDPTRNWEVILDIRVSRSITGVAIDNNGAIVATVRGVNDNPRHLSLEFLIPGTLSRAHYVLISDDYDSTWDRPNYIKGQLKRTAGDVGSPEALYWCDATCKNFQTNISAGGFGSALNWMPVDFTSPQESSIILTAPGRTKSQILQTLSQQGVPAKIEAVWEQRDFTVRVPGGSEQWVIKNIPGKGGIQFASYHFGTAGGSGTVRQSFADGTLLANWSPGVGRGLWSQAACKLKSALALHFRNTAIRQCRSDVDSELPELCFDASVEGHTAEQGGFSSANLQRKLDNQFLVRSLVEFSVMKIPSPYSSTGFVERLVYYVVETRVARQGPHDPADQAVFTDVERKRINVSNRELDDIVVGEIQQIVETANFQCNSGI